MVQRETPRETDKLMQRDGRGGVKEIAETTLGRKEEDRGR
jgi:hypothetical protein